jgi:hypothetical protein
MTITTPFGLFEYKRLPFGLRNAGASFQRHMDSAISEKEAALAFVDDVLVYSVDHAAHCLHLHQLFEAFQWHNLVIHLEKCAFGASSIDFLAHRVSAAGVQLCPPTWRLCRIFRGPRQSRSFKPSWGWLTFTEDFCLQ